MESSDTMDTMLLRESFRGGEKRPLRAWGLSPASAWRAMSSVMLLLASE